MNRINKDQKEIRILTYALLLIYQIVNLAFWLWYASANQIAYTVPGSAWAFLSILGFFITKRVDRIASETETVKDQQNNPNT